MHVSHVRSVQYGLPNKNKKNKKEGKKKRCVQYYFIGSLDFGRIILF